MREIQLRDAKASLAAVVDFAEILPSNQISTFASLLMNAPLEPDYIPARGTASLRNIDL